MNINEVLATLATRRLGRDVHPNDHVNASQSSNDVFPTSVHVAATAGVTHDLIPGAWTTSPPPEGQGRRVGGRGQVGPHAPMDATPVTLGQEFGGYAAAVWHGVERRSRPSRGLPRCRSAAPRWAPGSTPPRLPARVIELLARTPTCR